MIKTKSIKTFYQLLTGLLVVVVNVASATECVIPAGTLLPDLQTVVPKHLGLKNAHQQEMLRFSNGIANLGAGPLWMEPEFPQ